MHSALDSRTLRYVNCAAKFPIFRLCLYYIGWLLRRLENHLGLSFCSHIKTVLAARFL